VLINKTTTAQDGDTKLAFVQSSKINVSPCGRRRTDIINDTTKYRIPFDPEARINTELSTRKASGSAGFYSSFFKHFIDSDKQREGEFAFNIAGYSFVIKLDRLANSSPLKAYDCAALCGEICAALEPGEINEIYANIKIASIALYEAGYNFVDYSTMILRDQAQTGDTPLTYLDIQRDISTEKSTKLDEYYFSGMSFSSVPVTKLGEDVDGIVRETLSLNNSSAAASARNIYKNNILRQQEFSIRLFEKIGGKWHVCEEAKLPNIKHGDTEDSVVIQDLNVTGQLMLGDVDNKKPVMSLEVVPEVISGTETGKYLLKFSSNAHTAATE
jgi:hypothetical protein